MSTYKVKNRNGQAVRVTIPTDTVADADACPKCGENRMDWLIWRLNNALGEHLLCGTCRHTYKV